MVKKLPEFYNSIADKFNKFDLQSYLDYYY